MIAFLTAENIEQCNFIEFSSNFQASGEAESQINQVEYVDATKEQIDTFKCPQCGHCYDKPFPQLADPAQDFSLGKNEVPSDHFSPPRRDGNNCLNTSDCSPNVTISEDG